MLLGNVNEGTLSNTEKATRNVAGNFRFASVYWNVSGGTESADVEETILQTLVKRTSETPKHVVIRHP